MSVLLFRTTVCALLCPLLACSGEEAVPSSNSSLVTFQATDIGGEAGLHAQASLVGTSLQLYLPTELELTDVLVEFTASEGATVWQANQQLVSGQSRLDFETPPTIRVVAEDGSESEYSIAVTTSLDAVDDLVRDFMEAHGVPGGSYGVLRNGQLVYRNALGTAADGVDAQGSTRYRIASVSKPITLRTILQLVDEGRLDLDDTVFGSGGLLEFDYGSAPYVSGADEVTVDQLLKHTSGWTNDPYDPIFANDDWTTEQVVADVLENRSLSTTPGSTYFYLNFGYLVLGEVVAKVTGQSYEDFVRDSVLAPMGIEDVELTENLLVNRFADEAQYYSNGGFDPYNNNIRRSRSAAGWIAHVDDLARFLTHVDRMPSVPDGLSPELQSYEYLGFSTWNHTGSLPGTSAIISRVGDEFGFVALFNARAPGGGGLGDELRALRLNILDAQATWPTYNWIR